jgi:hypothetical protein
VSQTKKHLSVKRLSFFTDELNTRTHYLFLANIASSRYDPKMANLTHILVYRFLRHMPCLVFLTITISGLLFYAPLALADSGAKWLSGEMVDIGGFATKMIKIRGDQSGGRIDGLAGGRKVSLGFDSLSRIEYQGGLVFSIYLKDGREIEISNGELFSGDVNGQGRGITCYKTGERGEINFYFINHETGQEELFTICQAHVLIISFGKQAGPLKYNPKTDTYFPPNYTHDPKTQDPLISKNPVYWNQPKTGEK